MRRVLAASLMMTAAVQARTIEITRVCLPGFCIESASAFTIIARDPARGRYRLLFSRDQAVLYLQAGAPPELSHCGALCMEREEAGERRVFNTHTGQLMGRLIGPFEGCAEASQFHLYAYVYFSGADPAALRFERACPE